MMKKKILFVTSNVLPIPAVKGGAIETLLDILIEENEKCGLFQFYVICSYDKTAKAESVKFKHTHIFYFKKADETSLSDIFSDSNIIAWMLCKLAQSKKIPNRYVHYIYEKTKQIQPDFFIAEGGLYEQYSAIKDFMKPEQMYAHLHRNVLGEPKYWDVFPNALGCGTFIANQYKGDNTQINAIPLLNCADETNFERKVDDSTVERIATKYGIMPDDFIVLYVGRLAQVKGVRELENAILSIDNPKIKLMIVGSTLFGLNDRDSYASEIEAIAKKSKGRIFCTGFVKNRDLLEYVASCAVWCEPSIYEEPSALTVIEGLLAHLPLIITDAQGPIENAGDACLVIKRSQDVENQLRNAILKLYNDKDTYLSLCQASLDRSKLFRRTDYYNRFSAIFK